MEGKGGTFRAASSGVSRRGEMGGLSYQVINSIPANIAVLDDKGHILAVNERWLRFAAGNGGDAKDLGPGSNYLAICRQAIDQDDCEEARRALKGISQVLAGERDDFELIYPCHSPTVQRWFLLHCAQMFDSEIRVVVSHLDITRQKLLEDDLLEREVQAAINRLAGGLAHDFNNHLAAIIGYAELAQEQLSSMNVAYRDLGEVLHAGDRAATLIRRLLIYCEKSTAKMRPLSPVALVSQVLDQLRGELPPEVAIRRELDTACGPVTGDREQLCQLIEQLCRNGIEAMQASGGVLEVALREVTADAIDGLEVAAKARADSGRFACLTVTDSGAGIRPEDMSRVYDPYFSTKNFGRGLGLAVARGIVNMHGGSISIASTQGRETSVTVLLPSLSAAEDHMDK